MKTVFRLVLAWVISLGLVFSTGAQAQKQEPTKEQKEAEKQRKQEEKERKQREDAFKKEVTKVYKSWLQDEVGYIISDEERTAFMRLATNEEREQFIEQFWLRRDPTPDTMENEEKEEHYRRIAYANERFASGIPGWKTDRGRIYIIHGPADEVESHAGGSYNRPWEEGGGSTSVYPFEKWRYRYIEGIGTDVIIEFVDPTQTGEFRLTMDPSEKDALLHVPGAGLSDLEAQGMASKVDRFTRSDGTHLPTVLGGQPAKMNQFDRLSLYAAIQRPATSTKFKDLEQVVISRLLRDQIQFDYRFDFVRVTGDTVLVPVTLQIPNRQLTFNNTEGVHSAALNIYARITTLTGRIVQTFEDVILRDIPESLFRDSLTGYSLYQKAVPLRPGLYKLDVVIKDVNSGNIGTINTRLAVPPYRENQLASSTLILADIIEKVPAKQVGIGQFVLGGSKVRPRLTQPFSQEESLGIYLQVYNLAIDETSKKPSASIEYRIRKGDKEVVKYSETTEQLALNSEQITLEKLVALNQLEPGRYKLEIQVTDNLTKQTISPSAEFSVKAAEKTAAKK